MKRMAKTYKTLARALTEPQPRFVSMVKGGANMRPWRKVKTDLRDLHPEPEQKDTAMTVKTAKTETETQAPAGVPEGFDIVRLSFGKTQFETEDAVKAWLDEGGYADYEIEDTGEAFEVANKGAEFADGSEEVIHSPVEGLTVTVGQVTGQVEAEKTDKNASDVQPVATKTAEQPDAAEGAEVAKQDTDEAVPAQKGIYEVKELSYMLNDLRWLVNEADYSGISDETVADLKTAAQSLIKALAAVQADNVEAFTEAFRAQRAAFAASTETDQEAAAMSDEAKTKTEDAGKTDASVTETTAVAETGEAVEKNAGDAPEQTSEVTLVAALSDLTSTLKTFMGQTEASLKEMSERVEKTEADMSKRVEAVESTTQSRKGADVGSDAVAAPDEARLKAEREAAQRRLRSKFGSPNASAYDDGYPRR